MNPLVFIENKQVVTDSLTVAEVFGKEHKHVVRDIENQTKKLYEASEIEFAKSNFGLETYKADNNKLAKKYLLTEEAFTVVAFAYVTPEAMKMKVKFIQEFKRMRDQLNSPRVLSEKEQLMASMKLTIETSEKVDLIENKVQSLEQKVDNQITLDYGEQRRIQKAVNCKVYELESDKEIRKKLFSELHREIKDRFAVASYKDIKRKDMLSAVRYIEAWVPRKVS